MFAPGHHSAMKHAIGPRREMAVRTLFNILGPLTNPAGVPNLLLGVFSEGLLQPMAEVLQRLGARHVMVVHSCDGLDEISIADATEVAELRDGVVRRYAIAPEDFGVSRGDLGAIRAEGPEQSLALIHEALSGKPGPAYDIVALNAGAAIYVSDLAVDLAAGVARAREVLDSGAALQRMQQLAALSQRLAGAA
jgi:anthranilate phosphoribosyltransferase